MDKILSIIVSLMNIVSLRRDAATARPERGASTMEWVMYTAAAIIVAGIVIAAITAAVNNRIGGIF